MTPDAIDRVGVPLPIDETNEKILQSTGSSLTYTDNLSDLNCSILLW